jgi:ferritin
MMISKAMNKALNEQIVNELSASMAYRQMAFEFDEMGLKIFSAKFQSQADEEHDHAMRIARYIADSGGKVRIGAIPEPESGHKSAKAMVEAALASEIRVSKQIYGLVDLGETEKDHSTRSFLKWFVDEQVEEVSTMNDLLQLVKMAGEANLFLAEQRLDDIMKADVPGE